MKSQQTSLVLRGRIGKCPCAGQLYPRGNLLQGFLGKFSFLINGINLAVVVVVVVVPWFFLESGNKTWNDNIIFGPWWDTCEDKSYNVNGGMKYQAECLIVFSVAELILATADLWISKINPNLLKPWSVSFLFFTVKHILNWLANFSGSHFHQWNLVEVLTDYLSWQHTILWCEWLQFCQPFFNWWIFLFGVCFIFLFPPASNNVASNIIKNISLCSETIIFMEQIPKSRITESRVYIFLIVINVSRMHSRNRNNLHFTRNVQE